MTLRQSLTAAALEPVLAVRRARLAGAESALTTALDKLAAADAEIAALDADLLHIARQTEAWEAGWQRWTQEGGAPMHGKAYVDQHLYLAAWRDDLNEQRDEQCKRRAVIARDADAARTRLLRLQARLDGVQQAQHRALMQQLGPALARRDADAAELLAARRGRGESAWRSP
jgi:hypothetical protein